MKKVKIYPQDGLSIELMMSVDPKFYRVQGGMNRSEKFRSLMFEGVQSYAIQSYATLEYVELMYDTIDPKLFEGETITSVQLT